MLEPEQHHAAMSSHYTPSELCLKASNSPFYEILQILKLLLFFLSGWKTSVSQTDNNQVISLQ